MTFTDCTFQEWEMEEDSWALQTEEQNLSLDLDQLEEILRFSKSERILPQYEGPASTAKKKQEQALRTN